MIGVECSCRPGEYMGAVLSVGTVSADGSVVGFDLVSLGSCRVCVVRVGDDVSVGCACVGTVWM